MVWKYCWATRIGGTRAGLVRAGQLAEGDGDAEADADEVDTVLESGAVGDESCRTAAESGDACPPATRR